MTIDTQGYEFPSEIAFIPTPGTGDNDPLYFILELNGTLKIVTNDRSSYVFASNFMPVEQPNNKSSVVGAAGLCLDEKRGYVFVTLAYLDKTSVYRNAIIRFTSKPDGFGLKAETKEVFTELFSEERSHTSHQIGPCVVKNEQLFVAVGYGTDKNQSQNLNSTLGSILRMDINFKPFEDNPFYTTNGVDSAIDYIWVYGIRNIFGMKLIEDRLFVTENGGSIDRFNEINKGENYLYDGSDWSIAARADYVFSPSVGLVHLDYIDEPSSFMPENHMNKFVIVASGPPGVAGVGKKGSRSIMILDYDIDKKRVNSPPEFLLKYKGDSQQLPVSIELGPDGLYFVPLLPNESGMSAVFKIVYDSSSDYPYQIDDDARPVTLISKYQCQECHMINGAGGAVGSILDDTLFERLASRLSSEKYKLQNKNLDESNSDYYATNKNIRETILKLEGYEKVHYWLKTYLEEPNFDNPEVQMPNLGINKKHAEILAKYLLRNKSSVVEKSVYTNLRYELSKLIPELRYRHLVIAFGFGFLSAFVIFILYSRKRKSNTSIN